MATMHLTQQSTPQNFLAGTMRHLLPMLIENSLPFGIYFLVKGLTGASDAVALSLGALAPLVIILWHVIRERRVNAIMVLVLFGMLVSVAAALLGGDARLLLIRESAIGGLMGLSCLISLAFPRPLFFIISQQMRAGHDAQKLAIFEQRWQQPDQRHAFHLVTVIWGLIMIGELVLRVALVLTLPVAQVVILTAIIPLGIYGATVAWTMWYMRHISLASHS